MSSNQIAPPRLPEAPAEYSTAYMQDLIRALEIFIAPERNPGELRGTKITLTDVWLAFGNNIGKLVEGLTRKAKIK